MSGPLFVVMIFVLLLPFVLAARLTGYARQAALAHRERLLAAVPWRGDETVLDVGCGSGLLTVAAAKRVPKGRCIAVDVSPRATEETLAAAALEHVADRVDVLDEDARALGLPDETVDVVLASGCLDAIRPRRDLALFRIASVVRPGGCIVVSDHEWVEEYGHFFRSRGFGVTLHGPQPGTRPLQRWLVATKPKGEGGPHI